MRNYVSNNFVIYMQVKTLIYLFVIGKLFFVNGDSHANNY